MFYYVHNYAGKGTMYKYSCFSIIISFLGLSSCFVFFVTLSNLKWNSLYFALDYEHQYFVLRTKFKELFNLALLSLIWSYKRRVVQWHDFLYSVLTYVFTVIFITVRRIPHKPPNPKNPPSAPSSIDKERMESQMETPFTCKLSRSNDKDSAT